MHSESSLIALLLLAGCGKDAGELLPAHHAGIVGTSALSRARASDRNLELQVLDAAGSPVHHVRVHVLADLDWENPRARERAALRAFGSDQEKLVESLGIEFHPHAPGTYLIPEPERWAVAVARSGRLQGEISFFPDSKEPLTLTLQQTRDLRLQVVSPDGTRLSGIRLRARIDLVGHSPVIQPLGSTDTRGEIKLAFFERTLHGYEGSGQVVEKFSFLRANDDRQLLELTPEQIPMELLQIVLHP